MKPIFIVGCARTGSKLHADILNGHSQLNLVDELHYLAPWWLRRDFARAAASAGALKHDNNLSELLDQMYSGRLAGTFWQPPPAEQRDNPPQTIYDLDRQQLVAEINQNGRDLRGIFLSLISLQATSRGKSVAGAKFPVDISQVSRLLQWFPDARVIHLVRDPRAIYASMVSMDARYGVYARDGARISRRRPLQRLLYLISRFRHTGRLHRAMADDPRYFHSSFERLLEQPEQQIRAMAAFLGVGFEAAMLGPRIRSSSFGQTGGSEATGFDRAVNERWREHLPKRERQLAEIALRRELQQFGYS